MKDTRMRKKWIFTIFLAVVPSVPVI